MVLIPGESLLGFFCPDQNTNLPKQAVYYKIYKTESGGV